MGGHDAAEYALVKQEVEIQASETAVMVYSNGNRVAIHTRSHRRGAHTTLEEHMPHAHRAMHDWSPQRFLNWAAQIGVETREVVNHLLHQKHHQEQNYRTILALLSNAKKYGRERLNSACGRALLINSPTRKSVESILKQGLDQVPVEPSSTENQQELCLDHHENIRGENYYH